MSAFVRNPPLGAKQKCSLVDSRKRVNLWEGSVRSGKTFISFLRFCTAIAAWNGPGSFVVVGKSRDTVYRNLFEPIERDPSMEFLRPYVHYTRGATSARIMGLTVNVVGANDVKAEGKIRGMTIAIAYGDEVTIWPETFFTQLLARMSPPGAQAFLTTNPDSPAHWLKTGYLDRLEELPSWYVVHFTMDDNPGLTPEYIADLKAEYQGLWYLRFIEGLWVAAEGAIYPMWKPEQHVIPHSQLPAMWRVYSFGIDYGTTNATAGILLGLGIDRRLYAFDEWRHDSKLAQLVLTDAEISASMKRWLAERRVEGPPAPEYVPVDPAAASLKLQLRKDGVQGVVNANNDVAYGIRLVANLLGADLLRVSDRCKGLIKEIPGYAWDAKATEKGEDKPIKANDHSCDALRYAVSSTEKLWREQVGARATGF